MTQQLPTIECELRALITEAQFNDLLERLKREAMYAGEDHQETYYFSGPHDLRIQRNNFYAKIWLKKGALHDEAREEIEVRCPREEFENLANLFSVLGYEVEIKWFRTRHAFKVMKDISVMLDHTEGYGYIFEVEQICFPEQREHVLALLRETLDQMGISPTPKEEFDKKYAFYKKHWRELIGEDKNPASDAGLS